MGSALAQAPEERVVEFNNDLQPLNQKVDLRASQERNFLNNNSRAYGPLWVNFGVYYGILTDSEYPITAVNLWPDSNATITASDNNDYAIYNFTSYQYYNSSGDVLDLSTSVFAEATETEGIYDTNNVFTIDSLSFGYTYSRNDESATDTITIYILEEDGLYHDGYVSTNTGNPYPIVGYNGASNAPASYDSMIQVILTADDTTASGYYDYIDLKLGYTAAAGADVAFVYTYGSSTTRSGSSKINLETEANEFNLMYYSEGDVTNRDSTNMVSLQYDDPATHNQGLFIDFWQRYGLAGDTWSNLYTPSYLSHIFWAPHRADHQMAWYQISTDATPVGIEEEVANAVSVYPNPASDVINVTVTDANTRIEMYDVLGNLVYVNATPSLSTRIDVANLAPGMYTVKVANKIEKVIIK